MIDVSGLHIGDSNLGFLTAGAVVRVDYGCCDRGNPIACSFFNVGLGFVVCLREEPPTSDRLVRLAFNHCNALSEDFPVYVIERFSDDQADEFLQRYLASDVVGAMYLVRHNSTP